MGTEFIETLRQVIYPGDCDPMGHLNTRHYAALFDHATWRLLLNLGVDDDCGGAAQFGWADVETSVNYRREVTVGSCACVLSRLASVGNKSLVTEHMLVVNGPEDERARCRIKSVRIDLLARRSVEVPQVLHRYRQT
jgi:acyl-CoA thioester hydrolase